MHMRKSHCSQEAMCQGNFLCYALLRIVELDSTILRPTMVLSPRSVRSSVTIQAFTERPLSDAAFVFARSPDLTPFGRSENRGPVPLRELRLDTACQKWLTCCTFSNYSTSWSTEQTCHSSWALLTMNWGYNFFPSVAILLSSHCLIFLSSEDSDILMLSRECSEEGGETVNMWLMYFN